MAKLTVYLDKSVRSQAAKQQLANLGIDYTAINVEEDAAALQFLESQGRDRAHYPLPQYYVGETVAWANGYKDVSTLNATQINQKVEELNAS